MCTNHIHPCKYCGRDYPCVLSNDSCPTMNFDDDKNLCRNCRDILEDLLAQELIDMRNWKVMLGKFVR